MKKKISQKILKYTTIFEPAEEGGYVVYVPALPGCVTEGDTLEEAVEMVKDAISGYITSLKKHHEPVPEEKGPSFMTTIDIPVQSPY
ncbi:MAG: type II toxin-antitoxin system HicB family antitoxin [Candidatus Levybacteria bacterium]|nr:type II toxin-antitoxin system HicB family antitoxin [Candidatus Levybacteria bacterium]